MQHFFVLAARYPLQAYFYEIYTMVVWYWFDPIDRTNTEEVPNNYRPTTEQIANKCKARLFVFIFTCINNLIFKQLLISINIH